MFWFFLATMVPALTAVTLTPETVTGRRTPSLAIPRSALPDRGESRSEFLRAAALVFAAFAVCGLFSSLVPAFLREGMHVHNYAVVSSEVGLLFIAVVMTQLAAFQLWLAKRWPAASLLVAGVAVFEAGLWTPSLPVFVVATVLAGVGVGLAFRRGIGVTQRLAHPRHRADLLASCFLAAYAGTVIPTLALGVLDQAVNDHVATLLLAIAVIGTTPAAVRTAPHHHPSSAPNRTRTPEL